MIRLTGTLLLAGGAAGLGISAARRTGRRVRELRMLAEGLRAVLRELTYRLAPLPELLCSAKEQTGGRVEQFFSLCAQGAEQLNGQTFQRVWEQAAQESGMCLDREDWCCVQPLGRVLGRYDAESQRRAVEAALTGLEQRRREAAEQSRTLGKVYSVLGLTAGALLVILLL